MVYCYIVSVLFLLFFWCPCMAINVSVQYNGGLLPDVILLTQCYFHRCILRCEAGGDVENERLTVPESSIALFTAYM